MRTLVPLASTIFFRAALGALLTTPQTLPRTEYDFIVIGGKFPQYSIQNRRALLAGTAGNVIATRLSENPNITVAVLEAGLRYTRFAS